MAPFVLVVIHVDFEKGMNRPMVGNRVFKYPGTRNDYLRQVLVNFGLASLSAVSLFLLVFVTDMYLLGRGYIQTAHLGLLILLVAVWGLLLVQMAFTFARFEIDVDDKGLTVHRSGRSDFIPFSVIESVETINRPMWWVMRTDLKPLSETSRIMIRVLRKDRPSLTFAGGLEDEEKLMEILRSQLGEQGDQ